jgi:hypothetical protein
MSDTNELTKTQQDIVKVCDSLRDFLVEKNRRYGNSATAPARVFSKLGPEEGILLRLDDKLNRIKNSTEHRKNDFADLAGYIILLAVQKGWLSFDELLD